MELRSYQLDAVDAIYRSVKNGGHPICTMATGAGKSLVISEICKIVDSRILVVTHRKELIEQNYEKIGDYAGIYSAGIGRRDISERVIIAGVQSIYKRMNELQVMGDFKYIIIDEAHLIPPLTNDSSMYAKVFSHCPCTRRIGLTATPYRLNNGPIFGENDSWFTEECYSIGILDLTKMGYLAPLIGVKTASEPDLSKIKKTGDDYNIKDLSYESSKSHIVDAALDELCYLAQDRAHWLLFAVDRDHANVIKEGLLLRGVNTKIVFGNTGAKRRKELLMEFKQGKFRALVNVGVLTTGFDAPCVDCVALLRATLSKSLCVQMIGRGTRLDDDKQDCLLLDFGGNLERHIPIDGIDRTYRSPALVKKEREDDERKKSELDKQARNARHGEQAARNIDPLSASPISYNHIDRFYVISMSYTLKEAKRFPGRHNLVATYKCQTTDGNPKTITQFICVDYPGRPGKEAESWFERRGLSKPVSGKSSLKTAWQSPSPRFILAYKDGDWYRILEECFDDEDLDNISF